MSTAIPTINFGRLEDLITETKDNIRTGKRLLQGVRLSTHYATHSGTMGEKITVVRLILTTLTTDAQGACALYGLWSWRLASHGEAHGRSLWSWTEQDSDRLAREAIASVTSVIEQETGIVPQTGSMYCVPAEWLDIAGGTNLLQLSLLIELVNPGEGMRARRVKAPGACIVLGNISDGRFQELPESSLKADERIRLVSPDTINLWLVYPNRYATAIAAKTESLDDLPTYRILYDPEQGWLDEPVEAGSA